MMKTKCINHLNGKNEVHQSSLECQNDSASNGSGRKNKGSSGAGFSRSSGDSGGGGGGCGLDPSSMSDWIQT
jgi:hypothetical protein